MFECASGSPLWMVQLGDLAVVGRSPAGPDGSICYTVLNPKTGTSSGPTSDLLTALEETVPGVDWKEMLRRMQEEAQEDPFERLESVAVAIETLASATDLREATKKALAKGAVRIRISAKRIQAMGVKSRMSERQMEMVAEAVFAELRENGFAGRDTVELRGALVEAVRRVER